MATVAGLGWAGGLFERFPSPPAKLRELVDLYRV